MIQISDAADGQVAWTQCDSDADVWTFDADSSSYSPDPFSAGDTITFEFIGSVKESITVQGVHVKVQWGAITLSDADHSLDQGTQTYASDVDLSINFALPAVAPNGSYTATITGYDDDTSKSNFCVQAKFNL